MISVRIYDFDHPVDFLKAVRAKQLKNRSFQAWTKKLGYASPRTIAMVINGQRLPSTSLLFAIAKDLQMTENEKRYLELLVLKARFKKSGKDVRSVDEELRRLSPLGPKKRKFLSEALTSHIANWHHVVIFQLAGAPDFREDLNWIRSRLAFKLSEDQIADAIRTLLDLRLLERDPKDGKLRNGESFFTQDDVPSDAVRRHHRQMLLKASEALETQDILKREFQSLTFRLDPKKMSEAKKAIREFRDTFNKRFHSSKSSKVFQLNVNLFSHSKF